MSSTVNKQKGIQLIPFTVNKVVEQVNEIPPGVQLIHSASMGKECEGARCSRCRIRHRV